MKKMIINIDEEKINSFIIGIILMVPAIITFMNSLFSISVAVSSFIISIIIGILLLISILKSKEIRFNTISLIFIILLLIIFTVSIIIRSDLNYTLLQLCFYILIPIFIAQQKFSIQDVLVYTMLFSIPLLFGLGKMLAIENVGLNQSDMYNTYCFIPSIVAAFIYLIRYKKNWMINIAIIVNFYYLIRIISRSPRGFWFVLIFLSFLLIFLRMQKKTTVDKYYLVLTITIISLIIILINFNTIAYALLDLLESVFGNNVGLIIKTRRLLEMGDISNGRYLLWWNSIKNIINNPIFGYCLESTKYLTLGEYQYPHNFILQLWLDCGIVGLYPIYIAVRSIGIFFNKKNKSKNDIALLYFLTISIPIVILSYDVLKYSAFWILIGFGISTMRREKPNDAN